MTIRSKIKTLRRLQPSDPGPVPVLLRRRAALNVHDQSVCALYNTHHTRRNTLRPTTAPLSHKCWVTFGLSSSQDKESKPLQCALNPRSSCSRPLAKRVRKRVPRRLGVSKASVSADPRQKTAACPHRNYSGHIERLALGYPQF